jgi:hypothetical protein
MSGVTDAMQEVVEKLEAAGLTATCDPRAATPPCVLVELPNLRFDVGGGPTGEWAVVALAPNPFNLDAAAVLTDMVATIRGVLPVGRVDRYMYAISPDNPSLPAYRFQFTMGVDL